MELLIFFIIYFSVVFVLRSFLLWKRTGVNPLTFGSTNDAHGFNGFIFKLISIFELFILGIYAFAPSWHKYLLPFWYIEHSLLIKIGWGLLIISLILVWVAQSQMANSWRIGIDENNKTKLVTKGLFAYSRNPVFLGIMIANLGLFLVLPNAFTLLIVSLSALSMSTQIRLEEAFLKKEFGLEYEKYYSKTRRWL